MGATQEKNGRRQIHESWIYESCFGTTDLMVWRFDETFKMLIMTQYNIVRHGGVEAIEVRKRSIIILYA